MKILRTVIQVARHVRLQTRQERRDHSGRH
jgi:hypothetical protein